MPDRIQRFTDRVVLSLGLRSSLKWHSLWVTLSNKNVMYILFLTTCELLKLLTESKLKAINRIHLKTDLIFKSCHYLAAIFFLGPGVLYIPLSARYSKMSREYSKYFWPKFSKSSLKVTASTHIGTQKKNMTRQTIWNIVLFFSFDPYFIRIFYIL